jgi:hypothetical protein
VSNFPAFSVLDLIAAVVLMLAMLRRLEVKNIRLEEHPRVDGSVLGSWRERTLRMYRFTAMASASKVVLGQLWVVLLLTRVPRWLTIVSGFLIDGGWIACLVVGWMHATNLAAERASLGLAPRAAPSRRRS